MSAPSNPLISTGNLNLCNILGKSLHICCNILPNISKFWWHLVIFGCFMLFFPKTTILMNFKMSHYFWQHSKLHGSMILGIHMFVQLGNLFPEELKTRKQKITYINVTEDLFVKKKYDIKLWILKLRKIQKMSNVL